MLLLDLRMLIALEQITVTSLMIRGNLNLVRNCRLLVRIAVTQRMSALKQCWRHKSYLKQIPVCAWKAVKAAKATKSIRNLGGRLT